MSAAALPIVCAWCGRVRTHPGCWEETDTDPIAAEATHGICPECLATQTREATAAVACG